MKLTNEQYAANQKRLLTIAVLARQMDIDEFIQAINNAETVGPLFDPTLYMRGMNNLSALKKLALAVKGVREAGDSLVANVIETQAREQAQGETPKEQTV